jgi:HEAT repeat protein
MSLAADGEVWGVSKGVAASELVSALSDPEPAVRYYAAQLLPRFGVPAESAAPALIAATRDPHRKVRQQVIRTLLLHQVKRPGSIVREQAVGVAIRALADPELSVRYAAARGLIAVGNGDEALPTLVRDLEDTHLTTASRVDAVWCLSLMGTKAAGAISALQQILQEAPRDDLHSRMLRVESASILVRLGVEKDALTVLQNYSQDKAPHIQKVARQALERHERESDRRHRGESELQP